jgi:hypothetical protein
MSAEIKLSLHQDVLDLHSYCKALDAEFASGFVLCADTAHEREKMLRVARIQNVIGLLMYNVANYSASLTSFSEVLRIKRDILKLSDDTVVTTLVNISHSHYKMNEVTQALQHASLIPPLTILGRSYHELRQLNAGFGSGCLSRNAANTST